VRAAFHFRSNVAPQSPGAWARIYFTDFAIDADIEGDQNYVSGSILEHVLVEFAGARNVSAVTIEKSRPNFSYCEIRHNSWRGIFIDGSGVTTPPQRIDNCEIWDCHVNSGGATGAGILLSGGAGHVIIGNNIHNCTVAVGTRIAPGPYRDPFLVDTADGSPYTGDRAAARDR